MCNEVTEPGYIPSCGSTSKPPDAMSLAYVPCYMISRSSECCVVNSTFKPLLEFLEHVGTISRADTIKLDLLSFEENHADFLEPSNLNHEMLSSDAGVRFQKGLCSFLELGGVDLLLINDERKPYVAPLPASYEFGQGWIITDERYPKVTSRISLGAAIAVDKSGNFALLTFTGRGTGSFYNMEEKPLYVEYCLLKSYRAAYPGCAKGIIR